MAGKKRRPLHESVRDAMERQFADLAYFSPLFRHRGTLQLCLASERES